MVTRPSAPPVLPLPTKTYDSRYMDALIGALNFAIQGLHNPGPRTFSELTITGLKDAADDTAAATAGVPLNGLYHNAGALRIRLT